MRTLSHAFACGQRDALVHFKLAAPHAGVASSPLLGGTGPAPPPVKPPAPPPVKPPAPPPVKPPAPPPVEPPAPLTNPHTVQKAFNEQEQVNTQLAQAAKLGQTLCTTCRKAKHYGSCRKPYQTRPHGEPHKKADFNFGMHGSDATGEYSPNSSATTDSALARARVAGPASAQAADAFAALARRLDLANANEPARTYGGLGKVALEHGVSTNPYEEVAQRLSPPVGGGDEGMQRIERAFNQIDRGTDSHTIEGGTAAPSGGPAALG